jgi:hypothetical protein
MNNLLQLASSSLSPTLPPFAGEGAKAGLRPPKAIDDAGEDVLMIKPVLSLVRSPSPQPSGGTTSHSTRPASGQVAGYPARGEGPKAGLRPPKPINAGKTF